MALSIVRNDITRMEADAIVNSTNEFLQVGGYGVDASIHAAAGPKLEKALAEIGRCAVGSAVVTESFGIPTCRYIIHAVGPVHQQKSGLFTGRNEERDRKLLRNCYRAVFRAAREHDCRSVAMPLISAGANGFPKETAYAIATGAAREFLLSLRDDEDMMIYIVLYDNEAIEISSKVHDRVLHYISDHYRDEHKELLHAYYPKQDIGIPLGAMEDSAPAEAPEPTHRTDYTAPLYSPREESAAAPSATAPGAARRKRQNFRRENLEDTLSMPAFASVDAERAAEREERYQDQDRSFAEMCEWWCEKKKLSKNEFYTRANITRAAFWNMKHNPEQVPKKTNVLACAVGLMLNLDETRDLLMRAGMTLSRYYKLDVIVEYYIREHNYNIDDINAMLFEEDQPLLGSVLR